MWNMLWHKTSKLTVPIPETLIFCNGKFVCWLLNSVKNVDLGVIKRIKPSGVTIDKLRAIMLKAAYLEQNDTSFVATHRQSDRSVQLVSQHNLVQVLQECVTKPAASIAVPQWQSVKAFVSPLNDIRFVTVLRRRSAEEIELIRGSETDFDERYLQFAVNIGCRTFRSGYAMDPAVAGLHDQSGVPDEGADIQFDEQGLPVVVDYEPASLSGLNKENSRWLSEVMKSECARLAIAIADFFQNVHNLEISWLKAEFIETNSRRIILHDLSDVKFANEAAFERASEMHTSEANNTPGAFAFASPTATHSADASFFGDSGSGSGSARSRANAEPDSRRGDSSSIPPPLAPMAASLAQQATHLIDLHANRVSPGPDVSAWDPNSMSDEELRAHNRHLLRLGLNPKHRINWRRAAHQSALEAVSLRAELAEKERDWAREGQSQAALDAARDLRVHQQEEALTAEFEQLTARLSEARQQLAGVTGKKDKLVSDARALREESEVARTRYDALKRQSQPVIDQSKILKQRYSELLAERARLDMKHDESCQLQSKLDIEKAKAVALSRALDVLRQMTPNHFNLCRFLLDEALGREDDDALDDIVTEHASGREWELMKLQILEGYRRFIGSFRPSAAEARQREQITPKKKLPPMTGGRRWYHAGIASSIW